MAGAICLCFSLFFPLMGTNPIGFVPISGLWIKVFCQSTAYRSKLTAKLQFTSSKTDIILDYAALIPSTPCLQPC